MTWENQIQSWYRSIEQKIHLLLMRKLANVLAGECRILLPLGNIC